MDRRDEADQGSGISHGCDEERQDRPEGSESERDAKQPAIGHPDGDVKTEVSAGELFYFSKGEHWAILPSDLLSSRQLPAIFPLDKIPDLDKIKTNVRSYSGDIHA